MKKILCVLSVCIIMTFIPAKTLAADLYDGLTGFWTMDEVNGDIVLDSSGNDLDGIYKGTITAAEGKNKNSLSFSSSTADYIDFGIGGLGKALSGSDAISFAAWVNLSSASSGGTMRLLYMPITAATVGYEVYISGGALRVGVRSVAGDPWNNSYYTLPESFSDTWHHVAVVTDYKNKSITIYIDGKKINPSGGNSITFGADSFSPSAATVPDAIGGNGKANNTFNGLIDEVRLYGRALTVDEVSALAGGGFSIGEIKFYNGREIDSIESGSILCRVPVLNMGADAHSVKLICTLNKKSVNTMKSIKITDFVSVPMSNETAEITMDVPDFSEEYYLTVMVWDGGKTMQSLGDGILK
ncbi:MAG: LamG domain-containing protein [Clostridia bacterium]|nr:LamG domain-containing protein [Clostridia bacterium]